MAAAILHRGVTAIAIAPQHQPLAEQGEGLWPGIDHGERHGGIPEAAQHGLSGGEHGLLRG